MKQKNQLECCYMNRLNVSDALFKELEARGELAVTTFSCIGNCFVCQEKFHCIVNGTRIVADNQNEFRKLIMKRTT